MTEQKVKRLFKPKNFAKIFDDLDIKITLTKLGVLELQECQKAFADLKMKDLKRLGEMVEAQTEEEKAKMLENFNFSDPAFVKSSAGLKAMIEKSFIKLQIDDDVYEGENIEPMLIQFDKEMFSWIAEKFMEVNKVLFEKKK